MSKRNLTEILSLDKIEVVKNEIDKAHGLPNECYTSNDYLDFERDSVFLKNWIIRSETSNALDKLFVMNIATGLEEELIFSDEKVYVPNISLKQKDRNTDEIYIGYSSPKTPSRVYSYNLSDKSKKLVKEQEIPSGHDSENYIVERVECKSHDGRMVPLTITRHKKTKIDGTANVLLYGYGSYGNSMSPGFSSTRLSLINRDCLLYTSDAADE